MKQISLCSVSTCIDSIIPKVALSEIQRLQLASVAEQASLSPPGCTMASDWFSHDVAHIHNHNL